MALKRNILSNIAGQAGLLVVSLVSTHLVFHRLGGDVLGVIYFAITVTFLFIILADTGLTHTLTREIAAHRDNDKGYVSALVGSAATISWSAFLVSCLAIALLSPWLIHEWLHIQEADKTDLVWAFTLISGALLLAIPRSVYGSIIAGYERLDWWNVANVVATGLQQIGMIAVLGSGGGLREVALWYVVSGLAGLIVFGLVAVRLMGASALRLGYSWPALRKNLRYGSHLFANSVISYVLYQIDKWMISKFLPASQLGFYGVAQGLASKGSMVPGAIAAAAFPALSSGVVNRARADWLSQYHKLQDFTCYLLIPVTAAVAMLGIVVMTLVLNREVAETAWLPLLILAVGQLVLSLQGIPYMLALAMKKPELSVRANIRALIVAAPSAVLLTSHFGLAGAALTTAIASSMHMLFFLPRFSAECLETTAWKWYRHSALLVLAGLLFYGVPWLTLWYLGLGLDAYALMAAYVVGSLAFLPVGWLLIGTELKDVAVRRLGLFKVGRS